MTYWADNQTQMRFLFLLLTLLVGGQTVAQIQTIKTHDENKIEDILSDNKWELVAHFGFSRSDVLIDGIEKKHVINNEDLNFHRHIMPEFGCHDDSIKTIMNLNRDNTGVWYSTFIDSPTQKKCCCVALPPSKYMYSRIYNWEVDTINNNYPVITEIKTGGYEPSNDTTFKEIIHLTKDCLILTEQNKEEYSVFFPTPLPKNWIDPTVNKYFIYPFICDYIKIKGLNRKVEFNKN